jgi:hypothetical protein|eukprot:6112-Prymnesium_polylepis.1
MYTFAVVQCDPLTQRYECADAPTASSGTQAKQPPNERERAQHQDWSDRHGPYDGRYYVRRLGVRAVVEGRKPARSSRKKKHEETEYDEIARDLDGVSFNGV